MESRENFTPSYECIGNDFKFRYIKIKGKVSRQLISELVILFEINRYNAKIRQLRSDSEAYEQATQQRATIEG